MGINPKQINFPPAPHPGSQLPWISNVVACSHQSDEALESRANQRRTIQSSFFFFFFFPPPGGAPWSPWTYIFFTHVKRGQGVFFRLRNGLRKATEIRGRTDSLSHLLFLAISLIPIPLLRRPSNQNKIVISTGGSFAFLLTAV